MQKYPHIIESYVYTLRIFFMTVLLPMPKNPKQFTLLSQDLKTLLYFGYDPDIKKI